MNSKPVLQRPHFISDLAGTGISCFDLASVWNLAEVSLVAGDETEIGKIKCLKEDLPTFLAYFHSEDKNFSHLRDKAKKSTERLLQNDLESILFLTAKGPVKLSEILYKLASYLRAYLQTENLSIFGLPDGTNLTGLIALMSGKMKDESGQWNTSSMNIASLVIREKTPYVCADTALDKNFIPAAGTAHSPSRNMVCYPILSAGVPIGVINASNKLSGDFSQQDLGALQKFATVLSHILREEFETRRSEKFLNTSANLGKYLSTSVVRQIATSGTSGSMGGITKKVVVLFSDIRGFSTITEDIEAPLLVELLNYYFEEMSVVIEKYGGTLDKLVGDLMMVLWNIPVDQPEPELLAMKAAFEMQRVLMKKVAPKWADRGVPNFGVGIGINSGDAVAGNLGSSRFRNYTVIGRAINTAQRLEAKARAGEIWIPEKMYSVLEGKVPPPVRKVYNVQLKGLIDPVTACVFQPSL